MRIKSRVWQGHGQVGFVWIGTFIVLGAAVQAGVPGRETDSGSVRIRSSMPAGAEVPILPPTFAVRTETAVYSEDGVLPPPSFVVRGGACASDRDCDDCNSCTTDECIFSGGGQIGVCDNAQKPLCDTCGDDLFCNGIEICDDVGDCQLASQRPCDTDPTRICDEVQALAGNDPCVTPCTAADNVDDAIFCNGTEVCDLIECVGGDNAGAPCDDDTPCTGGGFCGGVVVHVNTPCGNAAACDSATSTCKLRGRCCTPDAGQPTGFACSRKKKDECTGLWLQVGDNASTTFDDANCLDPAPPDEGNAGETFNCPAYGAGVTPPGPFLGEIGDAGFAACSSHFDIGDDYAMPNSGPGEANENKFIRVTTFRWVGGFRQNGIQDTAGRYRVVFRDTAGNRIEDTITDGEISGRSALRTIIYQEKPIIPARGFVVIEPAPRFAPFARMFWTTTDAAGVDVGTNDDATYWVDSGPKNAQTEFPGSSGVLAYEIVGDIVDEPLGACCDTATGDCTLTLPWLCNGFFQGAGVACQVCENNAFTACDDDLDCPACASNGATCNPDRECLGSPSGSCVGGVCDAGEHAGQACDVNVDCDPGDTCDTFANCNPVPPACALSACCVTTDTGSAVCEGGDNPGTPCPVGDECTGGGTCTGTFAGIKFCKNGSRADDVCVDDNDCPDGGSCIGTTVRVGDCVTVRTARCVGAGAGAGDACFSNDGCDPANVCQADCPAGSFNEGGFGTSCNPQLCIQPPSGYDTCAAARDNLRFIAVPTLEEGPVTHTFSGDNTNATYGDHDDDAGAGLGTCNDGRFTSQGGFKDLGWWHAFSTNDCSIFRVDFCGTFEISGEVQQPQWSTIMTECEPCGGAVASSVVGAPVGDDITPWDRGLPHCTGGDDIWQAFGPMPAGTYYIPVFTAPGGHFGEYQLHVTVAACPIAACCLPSFFCVDPGTQFILTDGSGNPFPCDTVACADQPGAESGSCEACALTRETDCNARDGFWNGIGNLPSGGASFIVDCGFGGGGPCELGSCCSGPGECRDTAGAPEDCTPETPENCCDPQSPETCMTRALCAIEDPSANFVGGAQCDFPQPPCPACLIQGADNCQLPAKTPEFTLGTGSISDLTIPPHGTLMADDFIPQGDTLTSVCVWGFYHDALLGNGNFDCSGVVTDEFRIRVFGDANGRPDTSNLIGESLVTGSNISRGKEPDTAFVNTFQGDTNAIPQGYTLLLDSAITGLSTGQKHWLEVANNTTGPTDDAKTCWWSWLTSFPSDPAEDGYAYAGANSGGTENPADYLAAPSRYVEGGGRPNNMAFCVGTGTAGDLPLVLDPIETLKGCCWTCPQDGDPVPTVTSQHGCIADTLIGGIWNQFDPDCSGTFQDVAHLVADSCTGAALSGIASVGQIPPCGDGVLDPGEQCDPGPDVPGDNCDFTCQLICPEPPAPQKVCQGGTNNGEPCEDITECPDQSVGTSCEVAGGAVTITAGLHASNSNCSGTDGPTNIPSDAGSIGVGHDAWFYYTTDCTGRMHFNGCPTQSGLSRGGFDIQDNVVAIYHDPDNPTNCICPGASTELQFGPGSDEGCNGLADAGAGILSRIVLPNECYTLRMTNWGATANAAGAGQSLFDVDCIASACFISQAPSMHRIPDIGGTPRLNKKGRYLPVVVNDVGRMSAIQVEFVSLPVPYDLWNGAIMYAQAPRAICETSTVTVGACAIAQYQTSRLECTATPHYADWNALGVINLWHEGIVAGGTYDVRVIDDTCNIGISANFSLPTEMQTARFGDTVSASGPQFPADDSVDVPDAIAGLLAFSNAVTKPSKSRTELEFACIDDIANVGDVLMSLRGFSGLKHPAVPSSGDPCANQCPNTRR